jgi:Zn-dependent protease with chaperone function
MIRMEGQILDWGKLNLSMLENTTKEFFSMLGNSTTSVQVEITSNQKMEAYTNGIKLFNNPTGKICIDNGLLMKLSYDEQRFVLGHEVYHIDQNDLLKTVLFNLPKNLIDEIANTNSTAKSISIFVDCINYWNYLHGGLPPLVKMAKEQEINADIWAILATGNKTAAIECLKKLVNYDLNQRSHKWEVFKSLGLNVELPVMSMQQRIDSIQAALSYYETKGYRFK